MGILILQKTNDKRGKIHHNNNITKALVWMSKSTIPGILRPCNFKLTYGFHDYRHLYQGHDFNVFYVIKYFEVFMLTFVFAISGLQKFISMNNFSR